MTSHLRVVRGNPDDAELAALAAVLVAAAEAPGEPVTARPSAWRDRAARLPVMPAPGPGAWRASALPR